MVRLCITDKNTNKIELRIRISKYQSQFKKNKQYRFSFTQNTQK